MVNTTILQTTWLDFMEKNMTENERRGEIILKWWDREIKVEGEGSAEIEMM